MVTDKNKGNSFSEGLNLLLKTHSNELKPLRILKKKGDIILKQGNATSDLYLLQKGSVSIEVIYHEGISYQIAQINSFNMLGEMALFGENKVSANVIISSQSAELLKIKGSDLLYAIMFDTELAIELLSIVSKRSQHSTQTIGLIMQSINAIKSSNETLFSGTIKELSLINEGLADSLKELYDLQGVS